MNNLLKISLVQIAKLTCLFVCLIGSLTSKAQTISIDSIEQQIQSCIDLKIEDCEVKYLEIIEVFSDDTIKLNLYETAGNTFLNNDGPDKSLSFFLKGISLAEKLKSDSRIGEFSSILGKVYMRKGDRENALKYFTIQFDVSKSLNNSEQQGKAMLNMGLIQRGQGKFDIAAKAMFDAVEIFKDSDDLLKGHPNAQLGILYGMQGQYDKSIKYFSEGLKYFKRASNLEYIGTVQVNIANTFNSMTLTDSSIYYLNQAIPIFKKLGDTYSLINAKSQLGRAHMTAENESTGFSIIEEATQIAEESNYLPQLAYNTRLLADIYLKRKKDYNRALYYGLKSIEAHKKMGINEEYPKVLEQISNIYEASGDFKNALLYEQQFHLVNDSIYSSKKKLQLDELEVKYETLQKENKIVTLQKEKQISSIKRSRLLLGICLLAILGLLTIAFLIFKNKRDKQFAEKQRNVEEAEKQNIILENKILQQDLELKKRELVSSTLLISKKNTFLKDILSRLDKSEGNSIKVEHMIERELESEKDWDDFIKIFKETNPMFIENMLKQYENLTKSDIRTACLMRMNLNAKEIASVLNISPESVKKAKYRLRKKISLDASVDTQKFLIGF